jgi:hypothetical protein
MWRLSSDRMIRNRQTNYIVEAGRGVPIQISLAAS